MKRGTSDLQKIYSPTCTGKMVSSLSCSSTQVISKSTYSGALHTPNDSQFDHRTTEVTYWCVLQASIASTDVHSKRRDVRSGGSRGVGWLPDFDGLLHLNSVCPQVVEVLAGAHDRAGIRLTELGDGAIQQRHFIEEVHR